MKKLLLGGLLSMAVFGTAITVGHTQKVNSSLLASYVSSYQDTTKKDTMKKDTTRKPDAALIKK